MLEAKLGTPGGEGIGSLRTLRRIKLGMDGSSPDRCGCTLVGVVEPAVAISCFRLPTTMSSALRASRSAVVSLELDWASCRSVVVREKYVRPKAVASTTKARTMISAAPLDAR